jgi:chromosome partition protein MukE
MSKAGFAMLGDVIMDPDFPDLDLALRRGRHIDRDDAAWYALLSDAQAHLEAFYRRYGCELIHKTDGYYYLLPTGEKLSRKQLSVADMLVGQALALLYLDPATTSRGGNVTQEELVTQLSTVLGSDALIGMFNPKRSKRLDERIAQKNVRSRVAEAVRRLAGLGFVELGDDEQLRLRPALMRFAEPVRAAEAPSEALAKLVASGEVALVQEEPADGSEVAADEDEEGAEVAPAEAADAAELAGFERADAAGADDDVSVYAAEPAAGSVRADAAEADDTAVYGVELVGSVRADAAGVDAVAVDSGEVLADGEAETGSVGAELTADAEAESESDPRDLSWDDLFPVPAPLDSDRSAAEAELGEVEPDSHESDDSQAERADEVSDAEEDA